MTTRLNPRFGFRISLAKFKAGFFLFLAVYLTGAAPMLANRDLERQLTPAAIERRKQERTAALEAIESFTTRLKQEPNSAYLYAMRAFPYRSTGQYKLALKDLTKSLALDPSDAAVQAWQGVLFGDLPKNHEALRAYRRAVTIEPGNAHMLSNLAMTELDLGFTKSAISDFKKAVAIEPTYNDCYQLSKLKRKAGDMAASDLYMKMANPTPANGTIIPWTDASEKSDSIGYSVFDPNNKKKPFRFVISEPK